MLSRKYIIKIKIYDSICYMRISRLRTFKLEAKKYLPSGTIQSYQLQIQEGNQCMHSLRLIFGNGVAWLFKATEDLQ